VAASLIDKFIAQCFSFYSSHFIYGYMININLLEFQRGKKAVSFGKKEVFFQPFPYRRKIEVDICPITFSLYVILSFYIKSSLPK
jgi:hypothetical protein